MVTLTLAACALACSSSPWGGGEPTDAGTRDTRLDCSGPGALQADSIAAFVAQLSHSKHRYTPLSTEAMNVVMAATRALDDGDVNGARLALQEGDAATPANYRLLPLTAAGKCYWVLQPKPSMYTEQATLIYAARWQRDLVIEAPHVPEDHHTDAEAAELFSKVHAKAVIIAGAHRCSVTTASNCRPSTECNQAGIAVKSDPSHSVDSALHAMHLAFKDTHAVVLQLHTNLHPELNGDALVSNGTHFVIPGTPAEAFYQALRAPDIDVRSCNDPDNPLMGAFCG